MCVERSESGGSLLCLTKSGKQVQYLRVLASIPYDRKRYWSHNTVYSVGKLSYLNIYAVRLYYIITTCANTFFVASAS